MQFVYDGLGRLRAQLQWQTNAIGGGGGGGGDTDAMRGGATTDSDGPIGDVSLMSVIS